MRISSSAANAVADETVTYSRVLLAGSEVAIEARKTPHSSVIALPHEPDEDAATTSAGWPSTSRTWRDCRSRAARRRFDAAEVALGYADDPAAPAAVFEERAHRVGEETARR